MKQFLSNLWDFITDAPAMFIVIILILGVILFFVLGGGSRNVELVKQHAPQSLYDAGYEVVGYLGYQTTPISGGSVWYTVKRVGDSSGILYTVPVEWWFGEYHIYEITPIAGINVNLNNQ